MTPSCYRALADEKGQALVEYALILLLVATVCVGILSSLGTSTDALIAKVAADL